MAGQDPVDLRLSLLIDVAGATQLVVHVDPSDQEDLSVELDLTHRL